MSSSRKRCWFDNLASTSSSTVSLYIDHGDCNNVCRYCGALFWYGERLVSRSTKANFVYNQCCKGGRVTLPSPTPPHQVVVELYSNHVFMVNIRVYNSMFSMTSFGVKVDGSINNGSAPYVFKVSGQICHWLGSLCPPDEERPRFLQMYIYDTQYEVSNRLIRFFDTHDSTLSTSVVHLLVSVLEESNKLVQLFRSARDLCLLSPVPSFSVRLYNSYNFQYYDSPSPGCIGAIVTDADVNSAGYDIIIRHKTSGPQRISNLHPLYMSLQYPLLFLYGESVGHQICVLLSPLITRITR